MFMESEKRFNTIDCITHCSKQGQIPLTEGPPIELIPAVDYETKVKNRSSLALAHLPRILSPSIASIAFSCIRLALVGFQCFQMLLALITFCIPH